ncbi:hypothetical protein K438DRAFT_322863 [Mycena galopus ATCC 62051]|nr:hypothetical protein K438DRAFT_322863 [Mycena galopus ATCC 62051]
MLSPSRHCLLTVSPVYKAYDYPWFSLDDEPLPTAPYGGRLNTGRSIRDLDNTPLPSYDLLDSRSPPNCSGHPRSESWWVFRPCGHPACFECLGKSILQRTCTTHREIARAHGNFKNPIPRVSKNSWEAESIEGVPSGSPSVVVLVLDEDTVCRLHGATESAPPPHKRRKV